MRRRGRASKQIRNLLGAQTVTRIEINGQVCTDRKVMEATLLAINEQKMRASEATPFMQEPLLSVFGYRGNSAAVQEVLLGTFEPPPDTDPFAALLLTVSMVPPRSTAKVG